MRKTDLSPVRQKLLVPAPGYPGAFALVPPPTPYSIPSKRVSSAALRAHEALGALQAATASLPNPDLVTRTFDRREAVRSSQIEGTNSDLDELYTYEATGSDEGLPPDVVVTLNYVICLEHGLSEVRKKGVRALNATLFKELHKLLMNGVGYRGVPGEFRGAQNWIGSRTIDQARFVPPPPDHVPSAMEDLIGFLKATPKEEDFYEVPIVIRMAIAHAQFETIHPFTDGNGRVGRILLPLMLAAEGYAPVYIAGFLKRNQKTYYDMLARVQLQDRWADWVQFFSLAVEESVKETIQTANALEDLLHGWKEKIAGLKLRSDSAAYRLPEFFIGSPVATARQVEKALCVSFPAANNALARLEEAGIITRREDNQRNRRFVAQEVIEVLNRLPGENSLSHEEEVINRLEARPRPGRDRY